MAILRIIAFCAMASGLLLSGLPASKTGSDVSEYPAPNVREEQTVVVNGVAEIWQLKWLAPPKPLCEASELSLTCPCSGFAYGEGGILDLIRLRNGSEIDRLHIAPLFKEQFSGTGRVAIVPRWPPDYENDFSASQNSAFATVVSKRPTIQVMHFADYDHDGDSTEFYLQNEAAPCGKSIGVVIGISKSNPQLHAFGTSSAPDKPLYLQKHEWEALRDAHGLIDVIDWPCRDHGSPTQTTLLLRWTAQGITGTRRKFACTSEGKAGELLHEEPL